MKSRSEPKASRPRSPHVVWGELATLCARLHDLWYVQRRRERAISYLAKLEDILETLPENNMAIVREEGLALLNEMKGNRPAAIKHRRREIKLMEKLHA